MGLDAVVFDPALLGKGRWRWIEQVTIECRGVALIACTGSSTVQDRVFGLRTGLDDWLGKPCHPEELLARLEAVTLHRHRLGGAGLEPIQLGEVEVRPDQFQAFVGGRSLRLTRREYQLITTLAQAQGDALTREEIYERLWGYEMARSDRSVDVFVHKLRRKLEAASPEWRYIHTHFRFGYRLAPELVSGEAEDDADEREDALAA
jgi:DNA-binding response OmpR family regulator